MATKKTGAKKAENNPAVENPEFKQAVTNIVSDSQKQKGQDVCTDCFGAAGNDCRDCLSMRRNKDV